MTNEHSRPVVFVSSTIRDFIDLRSALKFWLEEMGLEVRMSEFNDFERQPDEGAFESCFAAIEGSDYYILLIGGHSGSEYERGVSVTRQEYRVAARLAQAGKLKPIIFVRQAVMDALAERKALGEVGIDQEVLSSATSNALADPEDVAAFVEEIRRTEFGRVGDSGPAGAFWHYRFATFRDIVDALRVNLRLQRSIQRQALLANLKWELEENIALLVSRRGDIPFAQHHWLGRIRREQRLQADDLERRIRLDAETLKRVAIFYLVGMAGIHRLRTQAISEAVSSGEFLTLDQSMHRLTPGVIQQAMYALLESLQAARSMYTSLPDREPRWQKLVLAQQSGLPSYEIEGYDLANLYALHDRMQDILRVSVALLRYATDPASEYLEPMLSSSSPLDDQIQGLVDERATHEDIERWSMDGILWGIMTDQQTATTQEDVENAMNQFTGLRDTADRLIDRIMPRVISRFRAMPAVPPDEVDKTLRSLIDEELDRERDKNVDEPDEEVS